MPTFCVVGFGPVGALLALRLAALDDADVIVIERQERDVVCAAERVFYAAHITRAAIEGPLRRVGDQRAKPRSMMRAYVWASRAAPGLKRVDVWDEIAPLARHDYTIRFEIGVDVARSAELLAFDNGEFRNCFIGQRHVEDALRRRCAATRNIRIAFGCELVAFDRASRVVKTRQQTKQQPEEHVVDRQFTVDFLFGCDGASSTVRRHMAWPFDGETRWRWCVTDVLAAGIGARAPDMVWHLDAASAARRPGMYVSLHADHFRFEHCVFEHEQCDDAATSLQFGATSRCARALGRISASAHTQEHNAQTRQRVTFCPPRFSHCCNAALPMARCGISARRPTACTVARRASRRPTTTCCP